VAELPRQRGEAAGVGIASAVATDPSQAARQQRDILSAQAELIQEGTGASSPRLIAALKAVRGQLLSEAAESSSQAKPLAALRRAHAAADAAKTGVELKAAVEQLEQSLGGFGGSEASIGGSSTREQLLQDGYFRLAEMEQRLGHYDRAIDYADRGLEVSSSASVARANLFIVKAQAQRARGESTEAAQSLMQALGINERLMKESLDP
jgi:tetratricopeptide (TPR) repeat protein